MKRTVCAVALLALGMSLTAPVRAATDPNCIAPIDFWSWKAQDRNTVILTDRARHNFKVSLQPGCTDISYALNIGVKSFSTSRLQCIAKGDWIIVPRDGGIPGDRCMINKVEAYTPDMAKADAAALAAAKAAGH